MGQAFTREDWIEARARLDEIEAERAKLLAPTDERYRAASDRLFEIEDELGAVHGACDSCHRPIFEGDPYLSGDDGRTCAACSPTWEHFASGPEDFVDPDGNPITPQAARKVVDAYLVAGGRLTDSMALPWPKEKAL